MNKIFFQANIEKENLAKFQKQEDLPGEINLPFLAFSKRWNKNIENSKFKFDFSIDDLLQPEKTPFLLNHSGSKIKNTYLYNKKIEAKEDKEGSYKVVTGTLFSSNPDFIEKLKDDYFSGFSIEVEALTNDDIFLNENNVVFIRKAQMTAVAALTEEEPAVASAGIIGNINFSKNADFGYEDIPSKVFFNNLNNNLMDDKQFNQLLEAVNKQVETSVEAKFTALQEAQKENQTVKFSLEKDTTPEKAFEVLQAQFSTLSDYELVKKEDGKDEPDPKDEAKFAKYQEALTKASKGAKKEKVAKFEEEDKPKAKAFIFSTINPNN